MKIIKPVDLICLNDKNQILLCLRAEDEFGYKETWSIPGGDSTSGESLEETVNREIKENWIVKLDGLNFLDLTKSF